MKGEGEREGIGQRERGRKEEKKRERGQYRATTCGEKKIIKSVKSLARKVS